MPCNIPSVVTTEGAGLFVRSFYLTRYEYRRRHGTHRLLYGYFRCVPVSGSQRDADIASLMMPVTLLLLSTTGSAPQAAVHNNSVAWARFMSGEHALVDCVMIWPGNRMSKTVGQDGKPPWRRVNNPPQVNNLPHTW
jgi:hypothetical protein